MKKTFVSLLLLFATFGAHGQEDDTSSSICAAEGEWKTNMCAKIIDFYGDVTCRKKLLVVQEDGSTIDILETITTLFAENLELKNRLAAVESTHGGGLQTAESTTAESTTDAITTTVGTNPRRRQLAYFRRRVFGRSSGHRQVHDVGIYEYLRNDTELGYEYGDGYEWKG